MRTSILLFAIVVAGCGQGSPARPGPSDDPHSTRAAGRPGEASSPAGDPHPARAAGRPGEAPSSCAFESLDALCASFREHYLSASPGWVSEGCGRGGRRTSSGAFAEALVLAVRVGYELPADATLVERPLLESMVREPSSAGSEAPKLVLAARIGTRWFPITVQSGRSGAHPDVPFEWSLDASGDLITWTSVDGSADPVDPSGYGRVERAVAGVDRGRPMLVAEATVESWRTEVDLPCTRACNQEPSPPPYPGCDRRCATTTRTTRSWQRRGATIVIGATETHLEGRPVPGGLDPSEPPAVAETKRLDAPGEWGQMCGFAPVVRAVAPATLPSDPASVAARERAHEILRHGRWADVAGARAAAAGARRNAILEIFGSTGGGCGGGGCSEGIEYRTIEGSMPEQGVGYFYPDANRGAGCDPRTLPPAGRSTFVEVAPVATDDSVSCGLGGFDGTRRRTWVVLRVFVPQ